MNKNLFKDILRAFKSSFTRFLSIMLMVALACTVIVGLSITGSSMRMTIDEEMSEFDMADIHIRSTYPLNLEDTSVVDKVDGIREVEFAHQLDVLIGEDILLRLEEYSKYPKYKLMKGRMPEKSGEIAIDADIMNGDFQIGDILDFKLANSKEIDEELKVKSFKIVGEVRSPEYLTGSAKGRSPMGKGDLDGFGVIITEDFGVEEYGIGRVFVEGTENIGVSEEEYKDLVHPVAYQLEKELKSRPKKRLADIQAEAEDEILSGEEELDEAKDKLSKAEQDLIDARKELDDGIKEYHEGKNEFEIEISKAENELNDAEIELNDAYKKIQEGKEEYEKGLEEFNQAIKEAEEDLAFGREEFLAGEKEFLEGKEEYEKGLEEFNEEIAKGQGELDKAKAELDEAKKEIEDGRAEYNSALEEFEEGISSAKSEISANEKLLEDTKEELDTAEKEIPEKEAELDAGFALYEKEKANFENELPGLEDQIAYLENEINNIDSQILDLNTELEGLDPEDETDRIDEIQIELTNLSVERAVLEGEKNQIEDIIFQSQTELDNTKAELDRGREALEQGKIDLIEGRAKYEAGIIELNEAKARLEIEEEVGREKLAIALEELDSGESQYNEGRVKYEEEEEKFSIEKEKGQSYLNEIKEKLDSAERKLDKARAEIEDGQSQLAKEKADGEKELNNALDKIVDGEKEYNSGLTEFNEGKIKLAEERADGERKLKEAYDKILDGEKEYQEGLEKFEKEKIDAEDKTKEGEEELDKARRDINRLSLPSYSARSADKEEGVHMYIDAAASLDILAIIFPVFFFAIAMLVTLTTMSRMIDEERTQIGTLEALGYSLRTVGNKYRIYGLVPSIVGALLGAVIGYLIISPVIFNAYISGFVLDEQALIFYPGRVALGVVSSVFLVMLVIEHTLGKNIKEKPAQLMRPRPPKSGARIFLERIKPLWSKMSFFHKVTARNIFRYKSRMLMTLLGVAGCTALIFMGFGIRDSIMGILPVQYEEIIHYDLAVIFDEDYDSLESIEKIIDEENGEKIKVSYLNAEAQIESGQDQDVSIVTLIDDDYQDFIILRNRKTGEEIKNTGTILTEKLAYLMKIKKGDYMLVDDEDGIEINFKVDAITENYLSHYIYLNYENHKEIYGKNPVENAFLVTFPEGADISEIAAKIMKEEETMAVIDHGRNTFSISELLESLNIVVFVLISISSILAIVVLYNLTNINISERIRELSTIKVLGFYSKEVTEYVYRETLILSILGILIGYGLGRILHLSIITALAPDVIMMIPNILWTNYLLSAFITLAISLVIMLIMHRKLKRVDMVEAMKAIE